MTDEGSASYRLVICANEGTAPRGYVYPDDAGAYTGPRVSFGLQPFQELPRIAAGDQVAVDGQIDKAGRFIIHCPDGLTITPTGHLDGPDAFPLSALGGFDPPPWVEVAVHGDPRPGGTPVIEYDGLELWPGDTAAAVFGARPQRTRHT